jgi:hypothetical protein
MPGDPEANNRRQVGVGPGGLQLHESSVVEAVDVLVLEPVGAARRGRFGQNENPPEDLHGKVASWRSRQTVRPILLSRPSGG